jgi:RHS repeat-associated protein
LSVYFDNLKVKHHKGALLEETHYYPFGLTMAGISSKAAGITPNKYKYNGKELQSAEFSDGSGLELYDYGARFQDPQLGRFFTQDRFAEKYASYSPYQYGGNNPIKYVDINGDSLKLSATDQKLVDQFNTTMNDGLGGFYTVGQDDRGNSTLTKTDKKGKMSKEQKALYGHLNKVVSDKKDVKVELVENDNKVFIGSYDQGKIDMADVANVGTGEAITSLSALTHEIVEQGAKQIDGLAINDAHEKGMQAEKDLTGYQRQESRATSTLARDPSKIGVSGIVTIPYINGKTTVTVELQILKTNLAKINRLISVSK